jgi:hypothetical protein
LFRGRTRADRTIQVATNSPVNHVGMSVVIEDLPALMWHAELGRSLPDLWSGTHQRGAQPHDLNRAVAVWATKYHQQVWLRQLDHPLTREMDDAVLRTIARLNGTPFPSMTRLASRWLQGRIPHGKRDTPHPDLETPTAPKSSPSPMRPWASCPTGTDRTGTTPAGSGAATISA